MCSFQVPQTTGQNRSPNVFAMKSKKFDATFLCDWLTCKDTPERKKNLFNYAETYNFAE
jgi:hypothetical protein